jgi:hypothetical protein
MEINAGARPEQLLRGVDRLLAVAAEAIPRLPARPHRAARVPARWLIERGETRVDAAVAALGGFPGSLRSMNLLDHVRLVGSSRYLVVGEGTAHGFAIPMRDVLAASIVRPDARSNDGLRIWYRDDARTGSFYLAFRGLNRGITGALRAESAMQWLVERGVAPVDPPDAAHTPVLHLTWEQADQFVSERIVWSGDGFAPVGGWFGARRDTARVWMTDRSLFWAGAAQSGLNRVALTDIIEARDGAGDRITIGIPDGLGHRYDLAFDLAIDHLELQRHANPRVRLMDALARHGVPVSTASMPLAPWRTGGLIRPMDRERLPDLF